MKFAGEHVKDGLTNHDSKFFLYSLMAVFCASYCGLFFLKLDQIPTVLLAVSITLAIYWQFRLHTNVNISEPEETTNHRAIVTIENTLAISPISISQLILQIYLWCGLSMKRNNRILTNHLAKLPLQFCKTIKIVSGLMEKSIPWKIYQLENMENDFQNLIQMLLVTNLIDESHHIMIIANRTIQGIFDLFEVEHYEETSEEMNEQLMEKIERYYSMGRPLTIITQGISVAGLRMLNRGLAAVIPIQSRFDESSMHISVGSPIMADNDIETYIQVEANRVSKL